MSSKKQKRKLPENIKKFDLKCNDGYVIACTWIESLEKDFDTNDKPVVIIAGATAVPQKYYYIFSSYLAENGITVFTFDWRGSSESLREKSLKENKSGTLDWGKKDLPACIDKIRERYPEKEIVYIGNSVGGHMLPIAPNRDEIARAITFGVQNAFFRYCPLPQRYFMLWTILYPTMSHYYGYYFGSSVGFVGNCSITSMIEWRKWCISNHYLCGDDKFNDMGEYVYKFDKPVLAISFEDDLYATKEGVKFFHDYFSSNVIYEHINSRKEKLPRIGHVGFFGPRIKPLWSFILPFILTGEHTQRSKPNYKPIPSFPYSHISKNSSSTTPNISSGKPQPTLSSIQSSLPLELQQINTINNSYFLASRL